MAMLSLVLLGFAWPLTLLTCKEERGTRQSVSRVSSDASSHGQDGTMVPADLIVQGAHQFRDLKIVSGERLLAEWEGPGRVAEFETDVLVDGETLQVTAQLMSDKRSALRIKISPNGLAGFEKTFWSGSYLDEEIEVEFVDEAK